MIKKESLALGLKLVFDGLLSIFVKSLSKYLYVLLSIFILISK